MTHRAGAAAHGRHERDFVAGDDRRVGVRVLAVDGDDALARPQLPTGVDAIAASTSATRRAVGQLDLEPVGAGSLTQAGEEADGTHAFVRRC